MSTISVVPSGADERPSVIQSSDDYEIHSLHPSQLLKPRGKRATILAQSQSRTQLHNNNSKEQTGTFIPTNTDVTPVVTSVAPTPISDGAIELTTINANDSTTHVTPITTDDDRHQEETRVTIIHTTPKEETNIQENTNAAGQTNKQFTQSSTKETRNVPPTPPLDHRPTIADDTAHERVVIMSLLNWIGVLLTWISLGFFATSLIYNVWQENENNTNGRVVDKVNGKDLLQWILIGLGCSIGATGAVTLTARIFALPRAQPWFKYYAIVTNVIMAALGYVAVRVYKSKNESKYPLARFGAGYEYCDDAFQYTCLAAIFLVAHEIAIRIVQRIRTKHHLATAAAARQASLKLQPPEVIHARQAEATVAQVEAEGARRIIPKKKVGSVGEVLNDPPHSRPTAQQAGGEDLHLNQLVQRLLQDKDKLSSGQLNMLFSLIIFFYIVQVMGVSYAAIEGWDLRQGIQFSVITVATIGFGDIVPRTTLGRALLFVFFPIGFAVMSYTISLLWTQLFTEAETHFRRIKLLVYFYCCRPCRERRRRKLQAAKRLEIDALKSRNADSRAHVLRVQKSLEGTSTTTNTNTGAVADLSLLPPSTSSFASSHTPTGAAIGLTHHHHLHGLSNGEMELGPAEKLALDIDRLRMEEEEQAEIRAMEAEYEALHPKHDHLHHGAAEGDSTTPEEDEGTSKVDQKLFLSFLFVVFIILGGAVVFKHYEKWTYFESVYFCFITLTTVGFGDFSPTTPNSKTFVIYYVMVGLGSIAFALSLINERISKKMDLLKSLEEAKVEAAEAERVAEEEKVEQQRFKSFASLPTWNERFLAANFELEKLSESIQSLHRTKHAPSHALVSELQTLTSTMASLALTVGTRQSDEARAAAGGRITNTNGFMEDPSDSPTEDELDLSSYGITGTRAKVMHSHVPQGKKEAKVVVPRTTAAATIAAPSRSTSNYPTVSGMFALQSQPQQHPNAVQRKKTLA